MLKLVKLTRENHPLAVDMLDEWAATGEKIVPWAVRIVDWHDFDTYFPSLELTEPTETFVPCSTFFCLDTDSGRFVGAVNIRHYLNERLLHSGGHIGDGIRPSERGKGYGTKMIALALEECDRLGIRDVLMCCNRDNVASARTIIKNGGVLENEVTTEDGTVIQRYWIKR